MWKEDPVWLKTPSRVWWYRGQEGSRLHRAAERSGDYNNRRSVSSHQLLPATLNLISFDHAMALKGETYLFLTDKKTEALERLNGLPKVSETASKDLKLDIPTSKHFTA